MIQIFGHHATKGVHELSDDAFARLLRGELVKTSTNLEDGFVILSRGKKVLGIGLLIRGTISSRIKKYQLSQICIE